MDQAQIAFEKITVRGGLDAGSIAKSEVVNLAPTAVDDVQDEHVADQPAAAVEGSAFDDDRTPAVAWRYRAVRELVPDRDDDERGTPLEMEKLADGLRGYYAARDLWFDEAAFTRDVELRFAIERGEAD